MSSMKIDFDDAPDDPIERLVYLSGALEAFNKELSSQWQTAYYKARQTGRIESAFALHLHSRKRVLAFTRAENEARGRTWRWGDGY